MHGMAPSRICAPRVKLERVADPKLETYKDSGGNYRWRLIAPNGKRVASSGESFSSQAAAKKAAQTAQKHAGNAKVESSKPPPKKRGGR